jgi:hypothetical protein
VKNDVNVPPKSNKYKKLEKKLFFVGILKVTTGTEEKSWIRNSVVRKYGSADPDPAPNQNVTDPQHCV